MWEWRQLTLPREPPLFPSMCLSPAGAPSSFPLTPPPFPLHTPTSSFPPAHNQANLTESVMFECLKLSITKIPGPQSGCVISSSLSNNKYHHLANFYCLQQLHWTCVVYFINTSTYTNFKTMFNSFRLLQIRVIDDRCSNWQCLQLI